MSATKQRERAVKSPKGKQQALVTAEPAEPKYKNDAVLIEVTSNEPKVVAAATARKLTRPEVMAAAVIESWQKDSHDVNAVADELSHQVAEVNGGSLARAEAMLTAQAHSLDAIFSVLARRATTQEYLKQWETYMRMAMKAQNQCRMTLETLAAVKNPPVVFAKQANINNGGQQQVNNGNMAGTTSPGNEPPHTGAANPHSRPTELLEASDAQRLDPGTASAAGSSYPQMAPVGEVHRAENR